MRRSSLALALAAILAAMSGTSAQASHLQIATVQVHSPVGSDTGATWMNCGWHTSCQSPYTDDGPGVDWWPSGSGGTCCNTGRNVYFRSWNYMPATDKIGTIKIYNYASAACYEARVDIRDQAGAGSVAGKIIFQHSSRSSDPVYFSLYASPGGTYSGSRLGSIMVDAEKCSAWTGIHVHEKHANGFAPFVRNVGSAPGAIPKQGDCAPGPCQALYQDPASEGSVWERSVSFEVYICANDPLC